MNISNFLNQDLDLSFQVLTSPFYQEMCHHPLFDLFRASREAKRNPQAILNLQIQASILLLVFQKLKVESKRSNDQVGLATAKRLIIILQQIMDALAWRTLEYDRAKIQLMSDHHSTGHLDDTVFLDLIEAKRIINDNNAIVLVNDLTNILRYGDLTIIQNGIIKTKENKFGNASGRNSRARQQKRNLDKLNNFLKISTRTTEDGRDFIFQAPVSVKSYHTAIAELISRAKKDGYHHIRLSDCLVVQALYMKSQNPHWPDEYPFNRGEPIIRMSNVDILEKPIIRTAPYGIFPLDDTTCFDLIVGDVIVVATLNLNCLQNRYRQFGLALDIPLLSQDEIKAISRASMAEIKKLLPDFDLIIRDGNYSLPISAAHFCPIFLEFLHEDTIISADRNLINFMKSFEISDRTGFYVGFGNEKRIWH